MTIVSLTPSMGEPLAALHARAFSGSEAWSASAIEASLQQSVNSGFGIDDGRIQSFIIIQTVADAAEILTIATDPEAQRQGFAKRLLVHIEQRIRPQKVMLEVAQDNPGAIAFYERAGFTKDGCRPEYYRRLEGPRIDAILMSKRLAGQTHR